MIARRFLFIIYSLSLLSIKNNTNTLLNDHEYKVSQLADIEFNFDKNNFNEEYFFGTINIIAKKYDQEKFNIGISIFNDDSSYTYKDDESLKKIYKLSFKYNKFDFKIPIFEISNNFRIKIEYNIDIDTLDYFFVDFTSKDVSTSSIENNLVESVLCKDHKIEYKYINFNFESIINALNLEYYNYLNFIKFKIKIDNLSSIEEVNFRIYDRDKVFINILNYDSNWGIINLNGDYIDNLLILENSSLYYLETINFSLSNVKNGFYNTEVNELYFPNNYFEYFNNQDIKLVFKNLNQRFNLYFEYKIAFSFKERHRRSMVIQENDSVLNYSNYEEVYL